MYVPPYHAQGDHAEVTRFIEEHSFATLCSVDDRGVPFATHLPLLLTAAASGGVALEGHVARANPQWRHADGNAVVAIFHGPHHYVSPTWYDEPGTVPTWNYLAVHATGTFQALHEPETLRRILRRLVAVHEATMPSPWRPDGKEVDRLLGGIVGVRIAVATLEGKWKLNQNQSAARRDRVIRALEAQGGEDAKAIAERMRRLEG